MESNFVGDNRKLVVYRIDHLTGDSSEIIGTAWQGENGGINGTGVVKSIIAEPVMKSTMETGAAGEDISPLFLLFSFFQRSVFVRADLE